MNILKAAESYTFKWMSCMLFELYLNKPVKERYSEAKRQYYEIFGLINLHISM